MNREQLQNKLISDGFPKDAYNLKGGLPNEVYCLGKHNGNWEVYYSERGQKTNLRLFTLETEACDYFYAFISQDMSIK
jgi:hypothetical protein